MLCFRTWNTEMNKRHKNHIGLLSATKRSKMEGSNGGGACNFKQWSRKESQKRWHLNKNKGDKGVSHVDICGKTVPGRRNKGFELGMFWPIARTAKSLCGWGRGARGQWRWWLQKGMEQRRWAYHRGPVGHFKDLGFYSEQITNLRQKSLKEFEICSTSVHLSEVFDSISPTQSQVTWQAEGTLYLPYVIKHCLFQRKRTGKISAVWIANK